MPLNPDAIGETTDPIPFDWTDRDTLLYAIGVGAGTDDLAFTTENSHEIEQQVLPLIAAGTVKPIMDSTFPLREAAAAHARMESSAHIGKIVLTL